MGVEALSPWVSLAAGVLSIGYVVVDEWRSQPAVSPDGSGSQGRSLAAAVKTHDFPLIVAVTMFFLAGLAHWYLRSTAFFYPVFFWGVATFVVVVVAIMDFAEE